MVNWLVEVFHPNNHLDKQFIISPKVNYQSTTNMFDLLYSHSLLILFPLFSSLLFIETLSGYGITVNLLFLNPRLWSFQYPMLEKLRDEGYPIEGACIAAGVPSPDKSREIIANFRKIGLRHVSFKPGSIAAIESVLAIAKENPTTNIILQWTGGRAGGHHSFEDFHSPILETYGKIRHHSNVVLVGGSGFGDAEHSWPYLSGEWSVKLGYPAMPFDAILIASR